jgi:hypothetical protein
MGTCPCDTIAPSASRVLMVMGGLEAWCCIGHYIYVLGPSQGSSERSLWIRQVLYLLFTFTYIFTLDSP